MSGTFLTSKDPAATLTPATDVLYIEQVGRTPGSRKISVTNLLKPATDAIAAEVLRATGAEAALDTSVDALQTGLSSLTTDVNNLQTTVDRIDPGQNAQEITLAGMIASATFVNPGNVKYRGKVLSVNGGGNSTIFLDIEIQWGATTSTATTSGVRLNNGLPGIGAALKARIDDEFGVVGTEWGIPRLLGHFWLHDSGSADKPRGTVWLQYNGGGPYFAFESESAAVSSSAIYSYGRLSFRITTNADNP